MNSPQPSVRKLIAFALLTLAVVGGVGVATVAHFIVKLAHAVCSGSNC